MDEGGVLAGDRRLAAGGAEDQRETGGEGEEARGGHAVASGDGVGFRRTLWPDARPPATCGPRPGVISVDSS